ncbi:hypothetical protein BJF79_47325 [Actinomadura sp. CNU-125]|nr:hypothetical protein BJF79_47325 [Actinomadura sp. CNU-125]
MISVWYETQVRGDVGTGWNPARATTVDLRDGTAYRPIDLFRVQDGPGLAPLTAIVAARLPGGEICPADLDSPYATGITPELLRSEDVAVGPTPTGIRVSFHAARLGYISACGTRTAEIPYAEVEGLLKPELLEAVPYPGGGPSPARS